MKQNKIRGEHEILKDIEELCKSEGYAHALALLCFEANYIRKKELSNYEEAEERHQESILRAEIDLLIGFMLKAEIGNFLKIIPTKEIQNSVKKTKGLLYELFTLLNLPNLNFRNKAAEENTIGAKEFYKEAVIERALKASFLYSAETEYEFQYENLVYKKHKNDKEWFVENKGFSVKSAQEIINAISETVLFQVEAAHTRYSMSEQGKEKMFKLLAKKDFSNINFDIGIDINNVKIPFLPIFYIDKRKIIKETELPENVVNNFFEAFSINEFPCNEKFKVHGDFNEISARPLIKANNDEYILFQVNTLRKSFYESPFYWMQNTIYEEKGNANRGKFVEEACAERLRNVFGDSSVYENISIIRKKGEKIGEIDILVVYADRAIVVETKSKRMSLNAIKGVADQVKKDFKKGVQKASNQSFDNATYLLDEEYALLDKDGRDLNITRKFSEIFTMCVFPHRHPGLAVQMFFLLDSSKDHKIISKPYVTDIFVFDVLCEFLNNPIYFLGYQHKRARYFRHIGASNELSILGYYLTKNLWVEEENFLFIDDSFCYCIDESFTVRRLPDIEGKHTPEGILTRHKNSYFDKIMNEISTVKKDNIIDLAYFLFDLSENAANFISEHCALIIERVENKEVPVADFSQIFNDTGIIFHASRKCIKEATEELAFHCMVSKYRYKMKNWFGISLDSKPNTKRPVKCFSIMRWEWEKNEAMEEALKTLPVGKIIEP